MKSIIFTALLVVVFFSTSSLQCECKNKCCCRDDEFRLVPLYELYLSKTGTYYYTTSLRELHIALRKGMVRKGVIGEVAVSKPDCKGEKTLIPISRLHNNDDNDYLYQSKTDETHDGDQSKYYCEGIAFHVAANEKPCNATLTLYRFWNGKHHILVTDLDAAKEKAGPQGKNEGVIGRIWPVLIPPKIPKPIPTPAPTPKPTPPPTTTTPIPTTKPTVIGDKRRCELDYEKLLRLSSLSTNAQLYTTSADEANIAIKTLNFTPEGSPGYILINPLPLPVCRCNVKPVYRLHKAEPEDYYYTTSEQDADKAVSTLGYTQQGITFYCSLNQGDCGGANITLYQYKRKTGHFYTTDSKEGISIGGQPDGVLCYIWAT